MCAKTIRACPGRTSATAARVIRVLSAMSPSHQPCLAEPPAMPDDFIRDIEAEALYEALDQFANKVKCPPH